jgi:hypothetical protein
MEKVIGFIKRRFQRKTAVGDHDARAALFPDWGLRRESEELSAAFDPISLQLTPGLDQDVAEESRALMDGDLEKARRIARSKLSFLSRGKRVPYMMRLTQGLHELRHFHDHFGTTAGFSRVVRTLSDANDFHTLWEELKERNVVRLPLAVWARQSDAPPSLRDYAEKRRAYVEWFTLHDGFKLPSRKELEELSAEEAIILAQLSNLHASLPSVPLNLMEMEYGVTADGTAAGILKVGRRLQKIVPLGCSVLMEGAAFLTQRNVIRSLFGHEAAEDLHSWMLRRAPIEIEPYRYTTVDIFLTRKFEKFSNRYQLALTDAALMPAPNQNTPDDYPGMRLVKLAKVAAKEVPLPNAPPPNIAAWSSRLARELHWPNPLAVTHRATKLWEKNLSQLKRDSFWPNVMHAFGSLHLDFLARRIVTPNLLANDAVWFSKLGSLPRPPIVRIDGKRTFHGTSEQKRAFKEWYFFEHFQRHVLFETKLPCADHGHPHDCPGDPLSLRKWQPRETCAFSRFLKPLGFPGLKIERLHT